MAQDYILENKNIGLPIMADYFTKLKVAVYNDNYDANTPKGGAATWKQLGFSDYGKYEDWLKNRDNIETDYKNRSVEFDFFSGATEDGQPTSVKQNTTSDELINLDTQLSSLMKQSSFDTESYVDLFGSRIGYFPDKGFAPVRLATRDDVVNKKFENALGRPVKVGEIIRVSPGSDVAYWKTPREVFRNYSVPTTYNKKPYYEGQTEKHKNGRPIIFKGGEWVYND